MKIRDFFINIKNNKKYLSAVIFTAIFVVAILLDQLTKGLIIPSLIPNVGDIVKVIPKVISFVFVKNTGAAWGAFKNNQIFLIIMTFIGIGLILAFYIIRLKKVGRRCSFLLSVSSGLIIAGAIGNLVDRLILGYVRDFINFDFMSFPVFNFADIFLTFGIICMLVYVLFYYSKELPKELNISDKTISQNQAVIENKTIEEPDDKVSEVSTDKSGEIKEPEKSEGSDD